MAHALRIVQRSKILERNRVIPRGAEILSSDLEISDALTGDRDWDRVLDLSAC